MAKIKNLIIDQGSTFSHTETYVNADSSPFDLTSYVLYGQVRKSHTSSNVSATFAINVPVGTDGKYILSLTDEETQLLKPGRYQYDILIEDAGGARTRILEGIVSVSGAVTIV